MDQEKLSRALTLIKDALAAQHVGDLEHAIKLYTDSLEIYETAEGYTYLGWALSKLGKLDDAIEYCHRAIAIDPEFGNPYNDIGVYLMQRQRLDEAVPWLERAKLASNYEPRHYPYMNLARIYESRDQIKRAIEELEGAMEHVPSGEGDAETVRGLQQAVRELKNRLN